MPKLPPCERTIHREDFDLWIDGKRLRARSLRPDGAEPLAGPTLVFLHEGLGSIAQWRDFPDALVRASGLPAFLYDRLGHGDSQALTANRSPHYLEEEARVTLPQILAARAMKAPVLIGHSDGGSIALLYAAAFPLEPRAVITEASHVFLEEITLAGLRRAVAAFDQGKLRSGLWPFHGEKVDALFRAWADTWLAPAHRDWDITSHMTTLRAPLLMIQGEADGYGSPAQIDAVRTRVQGPSEAMLIPGCGHAPHHEARALVLACMTAFLQGIGTKSPETKAPPPSSKA